VRRAFVVTLMILAGYAAGVLAGYAGVIALSPNQHDRSLEALMTAFFATGPLGAAVGAIAGFVATSKTSGPD
jgi:hypothetical protein